MKVIIILSAAILAAGCASGVGSKPSATAQTQTAEDEAGLAAALNGRVAGPPQDCVNEPEIGSTKSYGRGAIVFTTRTTDVMYVNRPVAVCPEVSAGRAIKTQTPSTRFCRGDSISVFDPVSKIVYGGCSLGEFTPYTRPH